MVTIYLGGDLADILVYLMRVPPRQASPSPGFAALDRRRSIAIEDLGQTPSPFLLLWVFLSGRDRVAYCGLGYSTSVNELGIRHVASAADLREISAFMSSATVLLEMAQIHISRASVDPKL